jgi:hypothetical protein
MALTTEQRWIATKIDTRMQKLIRAGKDHMTIMAAMADHMPAFHQLLSTLQPGNIDQLSRKFPGFYRYAKILESLATGIQSDAIPVPGTERAAAANDGLNRPPPTRGGDGSPHAPTDRRRGAAFGNPRSHDGIRRRSRQNLERNDRRTATGCRLPDDPV